MLAGAARAIRALGPDAVIQGGDLIDNDQRNELAHALGVLRGGRVRPGSGRDGYYGVQLGERPGPVLLPARPRRAPAPGAAVGGRRPFLARAWAPRRTRCSATTTSSSPARSSRPPRPARSRSGDEALWELPPGPDRSRPARATAGGSPDGPPLPGLVNGFLARALAGPKVRVPADPSRREMDADEVVARLRRAPADMGA